MNTVTMGPVSGPATEAAIARHLVKVGVVATPLALVFFGLGWGVDGVSSCLLGVALVLANFVVSAWLITTTARISLSLMMATVLFGFLLRLGLVAVVLWLAKDLSWVELVPLGLTVIISHLGLLFWELRYISASLAFPGHKPAKDAR